MVVYLDIVLLENFLINFFLILISMQLSRIRFKYRRIVLASILGSLYTLTILFKELEFFTNLFIKVLVVIIMIYIVTGKTKILAMFKLVAVFFAVSIGFSGFCFLFAMAENPYNITGVFTINNYSTKYLLFAMIIFYIVSYRIYLYLKDKAFVSNFIYDLEFNLNGQTITAKAFLDTGNELMEPATMLPVIILEKHIIDKYFIDDSKCFYIPYKTVDGMSSKMKGIKVENISLNNEKGKGFTRDAIIACCNTKLSANGDFNALLSRGVI